METKKTNTQAERKELIARVIILLEKAPTKTIKKVADILVLYLMAIVSDDLVRELYAVQMQIDMAMGELMRQIRIEERGNHD